MAILSGGDFAPLSFADSTPRQFALAQYYPNVGINLAGGQQAAYGTIYRSQVWVATLVNKLAYGTARLPLKVYTRGAAGRADARDSPFGRLLRNPNRRHDPYFFWLWTASTFEVYGEAMWLKVRPQRGAAPVELYPMHPSNVSTFRADEQVAERLGVSVGTLIYRYQAGPATSTGFLEWPETEIVHFRSYNPDDQIRGLSRLEPLRQTLLNEDAARRATTSFWNKGARPGMALTHPNNLSAPAQERLKAQFDAIAAGADNTGATVVLEEGMQPNKLSLTAEEAQYIETRKLNREEVCAVYDVPPPVVHILDRATFSNITEQMRSMYRDTMAPRLGLYESVIDTQLRRDFDPSGNLYAEFLMDEVLRGAFEQRAAAYQQAITTGWMKPSEVRAAENMPDGGPEADRLYVNAATIPLGEVTRRAQMLQDGAETLPVAADDQAPSTPTKAIDAEVVVCKACGADGALSTRTLCRSCEGRAARMLAKAKETA